MLVFIPSQNVLGGFLQCYCIGNTSQSLNLTVTIKFHLQSNEMVTIEMVPLLLLLLSSNNMNRLFHDQNRGAHSIFSIVLLLHDMQVYFDYEPFTCLFSIFKTINNCPEFQSKPSENQFRLVATINGFYHEISYSNRISLL